MTVEEWVPRLVSELGLDRDPAGAAGPDAGLEVDVESILGIAGDVAHAVERKAAPVTTFLIGLAAGRAGGTPEAIAAAIRATRDLTAG